MRTSRRPRVDISCAACGTIVSRHQSSLAAGRPHYCSHLCANRARPKPPRTIINLNCAHCGVAFRRAKERMQKQRRHFCSRACQTAAQHGAGSGSWRGGPAISICPRCRRSFSHRPAKRRKYCSIACKRKHVSRAAAHAASQRARSARLRARRRDIGSHSPQEWEELKRRAKGRCARCKRKRRLTRDHIIALSKGGDDRITNIQPLCGPCNSRKRDRRENLL